MRTVFFMCLLAVTMAACVPSCTSGTSCCCSWTGTCICCSSALGCIVGANVSCVLPSQSASQTPTPSTTPSLSSTATASLSMGASPSNTPSNSPPASTTPSPSMSSSPPTTPTPSLSVGASPSNTPSMTMSPSPSTKPCNATRSDSDLNVECRDGEWVIYVPSVVRDVIVVRGVLVVISSTPVVFNGVLNFTGGVLVAGSTPVTLSGTVVVESGNGFVPLISGDTPVVVDNVTLVISNAQACTTAGLEQRGTNLGVLFSPDTGAGCGDDINLGAPDDFPIPWWSILLICLGAACCGVIGLTIVLVLTKMYHRKYCPCLRFLFQRSDHDQGLRSTV